MLRFFAFIGVAIACAVGFFAVVAAWILVTTPRPTDIRDCIVTKMFEVRLCPSEPQYVPLRSIAPIVRHAVIASEDGAFYDHHGFDWFEMRTSFEKNWEEGRFARGGSTITQQLAKNVYLTKEKSLLRKVREALIVLQLEKALSKDDILEKYLNVVEYGPGVFGIGPAARYYFQKRPSQLGPVESAFLAFLLPNPKKYSASFRAKKLTKFARTQIKSILFRLWKMKRLSEEQHQAALIELETMFGVAPDMRDEGSRPSDEDASFGAPAVGGNGGGDPSQAQPSEAPAQNGGSEAPSGEFEPAIGSDAPKGPPPAPERTDPEPESPSDSNQPADEARIKSRELPAPQSQFVQDQPEPKWPSLSSHFLSLHCFGWQMTFSKM